MVKLDHIPMLFPVTLLTVLSIVEAEGLNHLFVFKNPTTPSADTRIPTPYQSAVQARRVLALQSIATLSTVFPAKDRSTLEDRPADVGGLPVGLMDYYASCGPEFYNPTILAITIATNFKNAKAGSNVTMSMRYHPPANHPPSDDPYTYSPANMPRFSLVGYIEKFSSQEVEDHGVRSCFLKEHVDAEPWTPGNVIHESWWAKLVVQEVYWIGGFGDRAFIGWIPLEDWQRVSSEEVSKVRLVGEEGGSSHVESNEL